MIPAADGSPLYGIFVEASEWVNIMDSWHGGRTGYDLTGGPGQQQASGRM